MRAPPSIGQSRSRMRSEGSVMACGATTNCLLTARTAQLDAALALRDLDLPGNRLEALKGDRKGQYSLHDIPGKT